MKVLIVTGVFPPAIGGPATHAADVADELRARGHTVTVFTLSDDGDVTLDAGVVAYPRRWPWPARTVRMLAWVAAHGRAFDVFYATGLGPIAVAGARLVHRPVV